MSAAAPREWDATAAGQRIRVREHGPQDGPIVVVLHGYLEQAAAWDAVAARLAGWRVVAPDHRGHGRSAHIAPGATYHFWDYVGDVVALIDQLGGPVRLVGHSMGGTMAALVAATAPDRVASLVLVEGLGPPDGEARAVDQARRALADRLVPPVHRPVPDVDAGTSRMMRANPDLSAETARRLAARILDPGPEGMQWSFDARHRARAPVAFSAVTFGRFLDAIACPTLLVDGGASPMQALPDLAARRARLRHARHVVLDGVGHNPHHTCPERLAALLSEYLDAGR
jgi:pimeloyl-ACP methyl ester carboxylesterase